MSRPPAVHALPKLRLSPCVLCQRLSIRQKLTLAFGLKAGLTMTVCVLALIINVSVKDEVRQMDKAAVEKAEGVSSMAESLRELRWHYAELQLAQELADAGPAQSSAEPRLATVRKAIVDSLHVFQVQGIAACRKTSDSMAKKGLRHGQSQVVQEGQMETSALDKIQSRFDVLKRDLVDASAGASTVATTDPGNTRIAGVFDSVNEAVEDYEAQTKSQIRHQAHDVEHLARHGNTIFIGFTLLLVLINAGLIVFVGKMISQPLDLLIAGARRVGKGDLNEPIELPGGNEFTLLARTLNQMRLDLRSTTVSKDYIDSIFKSMSNTSSCCGPT